MADQGRRLEHKLQALPFDARTLLHLAIWGSAAAAALLIAVLSAYLTLRPQRAAIVVANPTPIQRVEPQPPAITAQLAARTAEAESEMRRLSEVVHALGSDRDQLAARIGSLERSLEDVSGALHRQATPPSTEPAPLPATGSSPAATAAAPAAPLPLPRPSEAPQPDAAVATQPAAPAPSDATAAAVRTTGVPAREAPDAESAAGGFGVDLGGATRFDGLRTLWHSITSANPALFEGLHPIVAVRESRSRGVDLRLIAGPLASTEAATRLCATLMAARRQCQMTTFEGQPLPLTAPEFERRPAAPTRNSASASPRNSTPPAGSVPAAASNAAAAASARNSSPASARNSTPSAASNSVPAAAGSSAQASTGNSASAANSAPASTSTSTRTQAGGRP